MSKLTWLLDRMAGDVNTIIRGVIAAAVVWISYRLAVRPGSVITPEWEAVLLVVVGYYFKDRPREDSLVAALVQRGRGETGSDSTPAPDFLGSGAVLEMVVQFILALALVAFTIGAFLVTDAASISGAWIGAMVLAVGFYFKDTHTPFHGLHDLFRTMLAGAVVLSTFSFVNTQLYTPGDVPLQWIGVVFIVVAFYFKEKLGPNPYEWVGEDFSRRRAEPAA